jgi:hypothetical protein
MECDMMKCYFSGGAQGRGDLGKRPEEDKGDDKEKDDDFSHCQLLLHDLRRSCGL